MGLRRNDQDQCWRYNVSSLELSESAPLSVSLSGTGWSSFASLESVPIAVR